MDGLESEEELISVELIWEVLGLKGYNVGGDGSEGGMAIEF